MVKRLAKSILQPSTSGYKILSHFYHFSKRSYLPRYVDSIEKILTRLSTSYPHINFIQVGSNDGISGDPINRFIKQYKWQGVLIEPIPFLFAELKRNYRDEEGRLQFLNIAVSPEHTESKMIYVIDEKFRNTVPDWYFQLGSFYRDVIYHHDIPDIDNFLISKEVPVSTLDSIIEERLEGASLDFLHIDAEGYDFEILKSLDFSKCRPKVVLLEFIHLSVPVRKELVTKLKGEDYKIYRCDQDLIALHDSIHEHCIHGTHILPFWT